MDQWHCDIFNDLSELTDDQWPDFKPHLLRHSPDWQRLKQLSLPVTGPRPWISCITVRDNDAVLGAATAFQYAMPISFKNRSLRRASQYLLARTNPVNFILPPAIADTIHSNDSLENSQIRASLYQQLFHGIRRLLVQRKAPGCRMAMLRRGVHDELIGLLAANRFRVYPGVWDTELPITWTGFEDYVQSLHRDQRNNVRKQIRKANRHGITIVSDLPTDFADCYRLFDNVANRKGGYLLFGPNTLLHAKSTIGEQHFTLFRAMHDESTRACLLMYHDRHSSQLAAIGLDYDVSRKFDLYRLLIYRAIEFCIDAKIKTIAGGMSNYTVKRRLGFRSYPTLTATYSPFPFIGRAYSYTPKGLMDSPKA